MAAIDGYVDIIERLINIDHVDVNTADDCHFQVSIF